MGITNVARRDSNGTPCLLGYDGTDVRVIRCDSEGHIYINSVPAAGTPEHHNGTVGTSASDITFGGTTSNINIHNTHGSNDLLISFDSGSTWYTMEAGSYWNLNASVASLQIKGSTAGTTYEMVAVIA